MRRELYVYRRDDPIFPASEPRMINGGRYYTSSVTTTTHTCVDIAQICDPISEVCQDQDISYSWDPGNKPDFWPSISSATETERTFALLSYALYFSSTAEAANLARLQAPDKGFKLAKEQWKVEARRWFETSLARMQVEVLGLAQLSPEDISDSDDAVGYHINIMPSGYKGMCNMVKFRSNGWRNVSVWGFFGVLFLVMGDLLG